MEKIVAKLLQSKEPSIRLRTLTQLLEPVESVVILEARQQVRHSERVHLLLSERKNGILPWHPYAKWYGAHWVLATLADLGYPKTDKSLIPLREQVYDWLFSKGHLEYNKGHDTYAGPVFNIRGLFRAHASMEGNAIYYLSALGLSDDRTKILADRLVEWQWPDGGWNCDKRSEANTSSFTETLLPLRGLAAYSNIGRTAYHDVVERAAEYFLQRRLFRRKRDRRVISSKFLRLHYPCYWHYDILFGLKVMKESGFLKDERCGEAISLLKSKRLEDGGFPAEEVYYRLSRIPKTGRSLVGWGGASKQKINEFITCDALSVLKSII
jgi:hypothetical protein